MQQNKIGSNLKSSLITMREGPISKKSFEFSVAIIKYCRLLAVKKEFDIARRLLRSGTSIGANVFEAQFAESRSDFIHKMKNRFQRSK